MSNHRVLHLQGYYHYEGIAPTPMTCDACRRASAGAAQKASRLLCCQPRSKQSMPAVLGALSLGCRRGVVWLARMACGGRDIFAMSRSKAVPSIQAGCMLASALGLDRTHAYRARLANAIIWLQNVESGCCGIVSDGLPKRMPPLVANATFVLKLSICSRGRRLSGHFNKMFTKPISNEPRP